MNTLAPMNLNPDLNTRKGIAAFVADLRAASTDPAYLDGLTAGPFKLRGGLALARAADRIQANANTRETKVRPAVTTATGIWKLDAIRAYGSPEAGLAAIQRQLAIQAADMDPADVKRCQRAANEIERHLTEVAEHLAAVNEAAAEAEVFKATRPMDTGNPPAIGSTVYIKAHGRDFKGTVLAYADKRDAILGKKVPHVQVQLTHRRETDSAKVYGFHRGRNMVKRWEPARTVFVP